MRRWLVCKIMTAAAKLAFQLHPSVKMPEKSRWDVDFGGKDTVYVLFFNQGDHTTFTKYHVVCVISTGTKAVLVDGAAGRLIIRPIPDAERFVDKLEDPDYMVNVSTEIRYRDDPYIPEFYSCAVVAKKLLGITDPLVQTPEQLMSLLWEERYE